MLTLKSFLMPSSAPEMTPWSYPKRTPASMITMPTATRVLVIGWRRGSPGGAAAGGVDASGVDASGPSPGGGDAGVGTGTSVAMA